MFRESPLPPAAATKLTADGVKQLLAKVEFFIFDCDGGRSPRSQPACAPRPRPLRAGASQLKAGCRDVARAGTNFPRRRRDLEGRQAHSGRA